MKGYDSWLDKNNPTTNEKELSQAEIEEIKNVLRSEIERVIDFYGKELEQGDITDVLNDFR